MQTLTDEQAGKLLAAASTTRLYVPIVVALATGLRRGELLALRWQDVDLTTGIIQVVRSLEQTKEGLRFKPPKTKRGKRPVVLPASASRSCATTRSSRPRSGLLLGLGKSELVFTRVDGERSSPDSFTSWVARVAKRAGVSHIMPVHGLRHTHITNLLRANVHPKVASERAGHSSGRLHAGSVQPRDPELAGGCRDPYRCRPPQGPRGLGWQTGGKSPYGRVAGVS